MTDKRIITPVLPGPSGDLLAKLEGIYQDIHANPELSMQEHRTAGITATWLREQGYDVTEGVGGTGVVGLLRNGEGPVVLLRADMDALPIKESTGLAYASSKTGTDRFGQATSIAHACGHDMHIAWLMGATRILAENRKLWRGTVMAVFQPGEETGQGARAMIEDGMVKRFPKPDVTLGQHVMPLSAGQIGWRIGTILSAGDSWEVTLFGRGAHGSMPQKSIDPVVMAASAVMRLQTVVSREVAMTDSAVVTVGTMSAGMNENIIPDRALLRLNIRTFKDEVRKRVLAAVKRILVAEAEASGAPKPPEFSVLSEFPLTRNDEAATRKVVDALQHRFGADRVTEISPATASEDFGLFGTAWGVPSVFWVVGGIDPATYANAQKAGNLDELPANHAPNFAPVLDPTLKTGIEAMLAAAGPGYAHRPRALFEFSGTTRRTFISIMHSNLAQDTMVVLGWVGTFAFALSGGLLGVHKRFDLFGVLFLSFVVAVVGGMLRDVLIGAVPPVAITDVHYFAIAMAGGLITFFCYPKVASRQRQILLLDAVGLALFAVTGAQKAIDYGINPLMAAILGMMTGIGGGMARDVLVGDVPFVLRADLYALAALAGAAIVSLGTLMGMKPTYLMLLGAFVCIFLRLMAIYFNWRAPLPHKRDDKDDKGT